MFYHSFNRRPPKEIGIVFQIQPIGVFRFKYFQAKIKKLEVNFRIQAINRARELGLL